MAVVIDIIGDFKGKKAFKDADKSVSALDKSINKLGAKLGGLFAADKIISFSKQSIAAFTADQKAAAALSNSLKNIGYGSATKQAEDFIAALQEQTGVLDDVLRPAYANAARATGSLKETQKLMALAFDVSSGSGQDYSKVVNTLTQAYLGNRKGLKSLNSGLTAAEIKTKSFAEITDYLSKQFKGSGAAALDTYSGKLAVFQVSVENAKETIGKGFIDAFTEIANDNDFKNVTSSIDDMAQNVADTLLGIGAILGKIKSAYNGIPDWVKKLTPALTAAFAPVVPAVGQITKLGSKTRISKEMPSGVINFLDEQAANQTRRDEAKADADAKKREAALLAAQKSQNKLALNNLKLQKAAAVFDMKKIQITAALKSAYDEETVTRLKLMLAIENEQGDAAAALQKKLDDIIAKNKTLQIDLNAVTSKISAINALSAQPFTDMATLASRLSMTIPETQALLDTLAKTPNPFGPMLDSVNELSRVLPSIIDQSGKLTSRALRTIPDAAGLALDSTGAGLNPTVATTPTAPTTAPTQVNVTVNGALDPVAVAAQIEQIFANAAGSTGGYSGLGLSWLQNYGAKAAGIS